MLYDSTKVLLSSMLKALQGPEKVQWDDQIELGGECLYEIHQMSGQQYNGCRTDPLHKTAALVPIHERAARAIPHLKLMVRAIRRKDQAAAILSGNAALIEM